MTIMIIAASLLAVAVVYGFGVYPRMAKQVGDELQPQAEFVGSQACVGCHVKEAELWKQSDHHRAMEPADEQSVLGDFNNAAFDYFGRKTVFSKKEGRYFVTTEGPQGKTETFAVAYTLGYKPLQQYLVQFDDGRIQTLPFAWDTRSKQQGGQRWFHLYPDENITPDNPLFWTRPLQNWNYMCADCHTTNYAKNFSDQTNTFKSHWSEMGNGCESCHGAGASHEKLMKTLLSKNKKNTTGHDLLIKKMSTQAEQIDNCGACHGRRTRLMENPSNEEMLQTWRPELLHEGLYFVDGQMQDEVFEVGSFMQSKMYAAGVTCTNCHDPHTDKVKIEGNGLCTQCHAPESFDTPKHHFHTEKSEGAQCINCHMPVRTYMVVDDRHDHRFSIPRPDLSEKLATPNTCVSCHQKTNKHKDSAWAAKIISQNYQHKTIEQYKGAEHFGTAFWQARHEQLAGEASIKKLLTDGKQNAIVQATAFLELARYASPDNLILLEKGLASADPLIRLAATESLAAIPPAQRTSLLIKMLDDSSRAVRLAAAPLFVDVDAAGLNEAQLKKRAALFIEYRTWLEADSDRASALVNLASFYFAQGDTAQAKVLFEKALQRDETSLAAYLNYADYYRSLANDAEAARLLRKALAIYPDSPDAHYAWGLLQVRQKQYDKALQALEKARDLAPNNSQFAYVYAVGLYAGTAQSKGIEVLAQARQRFPANSAIESALQAYCAEQRQSAALTPAMQKACSTNTGAP